MWIDLISDVEDGANGLVFLDALSWREYVEPVVERANDDSRTLYISCESNSETTAGKGILAFLLKRCGMLNVSIPAEVQISCDEDVGLLCPSWDGRM